MRPGQPHQKTVKMPCTVFIQACPVAVPGPGAVPPPGEDTFIHKSRPDTPFPGYGERAIPQAEGQGANPPPTPSFAPAFLCYTVLGERR